MIFSARIQIKFEGRADNKQVVILGHLIIGMNNLAGYGFYCTQQCMFKKKRVPATLSTKKGSIPGNFSRKCMSQRGFHCPSIQPKHSPY